MKSRERSLTEKSEISCQYISISTDRRTCDILSVCVADQILAFTLFFSNGILQIFRQVLLNISKQMQLRFTAVNSVVFIRVNHQIKIDGCIL